MSKAKRNLRNKVYKDMERKMEQAMQATPPEELYEYLMDRNIPKTEAEHFAANRIRELESERDVHQRHHNELSTQVIHLKGTMDGMRKASKRLRAKLEAIETEREGWKEQEDE